jgi:transposase-like protein
LAEGAWFSEDESDSEARSHNVEFKRQVAQECFSGEPPHGLAKRHDLSRNLIHVWAAKYKAVPRLPAFGAGIAQSAAAKCAIWSACAFTKDGRAVARAT